MSTTIPTTALARTLLVVGGGGCALLMIGPFQGLEKAWVPWDKAAHFLFFYGVTVMLYLAFPGRRRLDLTLLAIFMGCGIEGLQGLNGRDAGLGDMAANALGAMAVLAPMYVEDLRMAARGAPRRDRRRPAARWAAGVRGLASTGSGRSTPEDRPVRQAETS